MTPDGNTTDPLWWREQQEVVVMMGKGYDVWVRVDLVLGIYGCLCRNVKAFPSILGGYTRFVFWAETVSLLLCARVKSVGNGGGGGVGYCHSLMVWEGMMMEMEFVGNVADRIR
jgi:hypothetical protein